MDHLITTSKSFGDHSDIGYKGETSGSKTIFINSGLLDDSLNVSVKKSAVKSVATKQSIAINKSVSDVRQKQVNKSFIPICHSCRVRGHIRPRCFTLMSFMENHHDKLIYSRYFQKSTPKPKIDLNYNSRMKWVKKNDLKCLISYTCFRTCATNSWYF